MKTNTKQFNLITNEPNDFRRVTELEKGVYIIDENHQEKKVQQILNHLCASSLARLTLIRNNYIGIITSNGISLISKNLLIPTRGSIKKIIRNSPYTGLKSCEDERGTHDLFLNPYIYGPYSNSIPNGGINIMNCYDVETLFVYFSDSMIDKRLRDIDKISECLFKGSQRVGYATQQIAITNFVEAIISNEQYENSKDFILNSRITR